VTNEMFQAAAQALASEVSETDLAEGLIYPPLKRIRAVSLTIAAVTAKLAYDQGLAAAPKRDDLRSHIRAQMFEPGYRSYL
jgi:malate dehydrogenase (oxaloacetate-decarboxylating)(NADP+)